MLPQGLFRIAFQQVYEMTNYCVHLKKDSKHLFKVAFVDYIQSIISVIDCFYLIN